MIRISIKTPSAAEAQKLGDLVAEHGLNVLGGIQAGSDTVKIGVGMGYEAALDLLSRLLMTQPWYAGVLGDVLSDQLKFTAKILKGRDAQIMGDVDSLVNGTYNRARAYRPQSSPIVVDLDGDGVEIAQIASGASKQVLFDHNGDGIRTGSSWVKSDDALLVFDRNGNGAIDNGGEFSVRIP